MLLLQSDIEFIPSDKFRVLINATAGYGEDLSELHYSLQEQRGAAVLEIVSTPLSAGAIWW